MRHRLTWFEDQTLWTVDVEAESESAARQAWVDGALPRPEALVCGIDLIDRMNGDKVTGLDAARLFNVLLVDFDWPPPTPSTWNGPKPGPTGRNVLPAPPTAIRSAFTAPAPRRREPHTDSLDDAMARLEQSLALSDELVGSIARRTVTAVADHRDVPAAAAHVMLQQENSGYPVFEVTL
jgi:hypothetical protein